MGDSPHEPEKPKTPTPEDVKTVQLLAKGLLELYEPPLTTINTHLKELTEKQEAVQNMITSERRRLDDIQNDAMLDALLADISTNREKLVSISNSMMSLHKRVQSLSVRASNVEKAAKLKASQSSTSPAKSSNINSSPAKSSNINSSPAKSSNISSSPAKSSNINSSPAKSSNISSSPAKSLNINSSPAKSSNISSSPGKSSNS